MNPTQEIWPDGSRLTISLPLAIRKRGGRKIVIAPDGDLPPPSSHRPDGSLVKAIARASLAEDAGGGRLCLDA